ncbi:sensory neuron membrane protein 2-like isoform X2 [Onthophagus taurus]|nr:sensory neuron membrane protein 2-like isoform X2 [Onthophagus taurus]
MRKSENKLLLYWAIAGVFIAIIGILLGLVLLPFIIDDQINKQLRISYGSDAYERWRELPITVDFKIYIFEVENWRDVALNGARPHVKEIGPYIYKMFRKKYNISYDESEDSWTYTQYYHFEFDRERTDSKLSEDDELNALNAIANVFFQIANRYLPEYLLKILVDKYWKYLVPDTLEDTIFHRVRVGDILFDGYTFCEPKNWSGVIGIMCIVAALLDVPFISLQDDYSLKFSYFDFKQDKHDGIFTVIGGNNDISKLGWITQWNGYVYNEIWGERFSHCNKIQGRDGTVYPPKLQKEDEVVLFTTEICRTLKAEFDGVEVYNGAKVHRRVLNEKTFGDPDKYPENVCYCGKYERNLYGEKKCLPNGFFDISPCYIAPVIASFPHFLFADEEYQKTVTGLKPSQENHQTVIKIEPISGIPMQGNVRLQFNMILRPIPGIEATQKLTPSVCPIAWLEESVTIPEDLSGYFIGILNAAFIITDVLLYGLLIIGVGLFFFCGGLYLYRQRISKNLEN